MPNRGVYAITTDCADTAHLLELTEAVLRGGAVLLQYRNKSAASILKREQAEALADCCRRFSVPLIINDDAQLAAEVNADGVHLGGSDAGLAVVRALLGQHSIIGASCYNRLELAHQAVHHGASYIAFGAFHRSLTKPDAVTADLSLLEQTNVLGVPRVAIGGINADNAPALIAAGADLLAVISSVFDAPDPEQATRHLARLFRVARPE